MNEEDKKIIKLIDILKEIGMIKLKTEFYEDIGITRQYVCNVKNQKNTKTKQNAHFTAEHIKRICSIYNVNANWIFGIEENVFNTKKTKKSITKEEPITNLIHCN